jgi:hypothetical protein
MARHLLTLTPGNPAIRIENSIESIITADHLLMECPTGRSKYLIALPR